MGFLVQLKHEVQVDVVCVCLCVRARARVCWGQWVENVRASAHTRPPAEGPGGAAHWTGNARLYA